jgi:malate dehydrogenase (oxaloacetate-decarboxylating)(NADP+)
MHDDQHGTCNYFSAALLNALELADKKIEDVKVVVSGAGSAALACNEFICTIGVNPANITMFDKTEFERQNDLSLLQQRYATDQRIYINRAIRG